jgi:hypothetical protein
MAVYSCTFTGKLLKAMLFSFEVFLAKWALLSEEVGWYLDPVEVMELCSSLGIENGFTS